MKPREAAKHLATICDQIQDLVHIPSTFPPEKQAEAYEASRRKLAEGLTKLREAAALLGEKFQ